MIYQLESGKCIIMSIDAYLDLPDAAFKDTKVMDFGIEVQNPFYQSYLEISNKEDPVLDFYEELDYIDNAITLLEEHVLDKLKDKELFNKEELT